MPRIRSIKPEIWLSEDFRALSEAGRMTFICLITIADDAGRAKASANHLARVYLDCAAELVQEQLDLMQELGMVVQYEVDGTHLIALTNWADHQRVDKPTPSKLPDPNSEGSEVRIFSRGLANDPEPSRPSRAIADRTGEDLIGSDPIIPPSGDKSPETPPPGAASVTTTNGRASSDVAAGYEAFLAELNDACGRHFRGDRGSRDRYRQLVVREHRTHEELQAAARGASLSPFHRGENAQGMPYQDPVTVLRSNMLDTLIALGSGEITPGQALPRSVRESHSYDQQLADVQSRLSAEGR
jgi:hypothetical protein